MRSPAFSLAGCRVLVTGAAGFIGYHLCRALLDAGAPHPALASCLVGGNTCNPTGGPHPALGSR